MPDLTMTPYPGKSTDEPTGGGIHGAWGVYCQRHAEQTPVTACLDCHLCDGLGVRVAGRFLRCRYKPEQNHAKGRGNRL